MDLVEKTTRKKVIDEVQNQIEKERFQIKQVNKPLKGYATSYEISIRNDRDPLFQLQNTIKAIETHIEGILASMKGLKFVETLKVTFEKPGENYQLTVKTAYFNSPAQTITNQTEIPEAVKLSKQQILNKVA